MVIQLADRSTKLPKSVVENVLIKVGKFIYLVDFVILKTEKVANTTNQIPVIMGHLFLATANAFIKCRNRMMTLSFSNTILELNIFNLQKQPSGFDDIRTYALNSMEDSILKDLFDHMFATEY